MLKKIIVFLSGLFISGLVFASGSNYPNFSKGETVSAWASNGVNLREAPNTTAPIIEKLGLGRAVTVLSEEQIPLGAPFVFHQDSKSETPLTPITFEAAWVKVRANGHEGYVVNRLLMPNNTPNFQTELPEAFFVKTFAMKLIKKESHQLKLEETGEKYVRHSRVYDSALAHLEYHRDEVDYGYEEGVLTLKNYDFEQAIVFVSGLFPIQMAPEYVPNHSLSYAYDEVPNNVSIEKKGQNIIVSWQNSPD